MNEENTTPLIRVLWIDDLQRRDDDGMSFKLQAKAIYNIDVTIRKNVDDGIEALLDRSLHFDAVILDIDCFQRGGHNVSTTPRAFTYALAKMREHGIHLPHFVYSGYSEAYDWVNKNSVEEDDVRLYKKPKDKEKLFKDILSTAAQSRDYQLKRKYASAFGVVSDSPLLQLLKDFEKEGSASDIGVVRAIRPLFEELTDVLEAKGLVNLETARKIQGKNSNANRAKDCSVYIDLEDRERKYIPTHIKRLFHLVEQCANEAMHHYPDDTPTPAENELDRIVPAHRVPSMISRGETRHLTQILVLGFLEILSWVNSLPLKDEQWKDSWRRHFKKLAEEKIKVNQKENKSRNGRGSSH